MRKANFSFGTQQVSPFKEEKGNFDGILSKFPVAKQSLFWYVSAAADVLWVFPVQPAAAVSLDTSV